MSDLMAGAHEFKIAGPRSHRIVTADRVRLHLLDFGGDGPARLLLPGFHRRAETWTHMAMGHRLAVSGRTYALDFRGHGRSQGSYSFGRKENLDVEAALRFLRDQGHREICVVALSMGGYMALRTLGTRPEAWPEVRALAVISAPARWAQVYPRFDLRIPFKVRLPPRERFWRPRVNPWDFFGGRLEAADVVDRLPCPLQIHHHREDWLIRFQHGQELARRASPDREFWIYQADGRFDHADTLVRRRFPEIMERLVEFFRSHTEESHTQGPRLA